MAEDIAYRYTGTDPEQGHFSGIPARDLSTSEFESLDAEQQETVKTSDLYEPVESAPKTRSAKQEAAAEPAPTAPTEPAPVPEPEPPKQ